MSVTVTRSQALAAGAPRYFTGKPCPQGHVAERQTKCGGCCECSRIKALQRYHADPERGKASNKSWRARNLDYDKARARKWKAGNPEKDAAAKRAWAERNKDHLRAKKREWTRENAERLNERLRAQPEKRRAWLRAWHAANSGMGSFYSRQRRARRLAVGGSHTMEDIQRIYAAQKGKCAYCRTGLGSRYHVDHIVPVSAGGSNAPSNLQCTCVRCNQRKHNKPPEEFARVMGLLL